MAAKLLNLLAISTLAVLTSSISAIPAVGAVTVHNARDNHHRVARHLTEQPARKRDVSKRCKSRPSSSSVSHAAATSPAAKAPAASSTKKATTTKAAAAATKASTSKAVASTAVSKSSGSSNGCNGKIGLAWSNHEADLIPQFKTDNVCWIYDWQANLEYGMTSKGMTFIPMMWSASQNGAAFRSTVKAGFSTHAAGMNEPDIPSQSNLSPGEGASQWNSYLCPLKSQGYTLLSPATATGPSWLQKFKQQNLDCDWDITAVHVYTTSASAFETAVTAYHTAFNKPIMVTEYACQDYSGNNNQASLGEIQSFLGSVNSWMNSQDFIVAYFMFAPMTANELESNNLNPLNALISSDGNSLTSLGFQYIYS